MTYDLKQTLKGLRPLYKRLEEEKRLERGLDDPISVRLLDGRKGFVDPKTQPRLYQSILPGNKIYLLRADNTQYFKVGFTNRNVFRRMRDIEQACPFTLTLMACKLGSKSDEKRLLRKLAPFKARGEWFDLSDATVFDILAENFQLISKTLASTYSTAGISLDYAGEIHERACGVTVFNA